MRKRKNICILGGCGYIGTVLTKFLITSKKYNIKIIDTQVFGNFLKKYKNIKIYKKDIRELNPNDFKNVDTIIHLANIANDPSVEIDKNLSWEVNVLATRNICELAIKSRVKKIIYASSGSVYGIKKEKKVTEKLDLFPLSAYNKTKMIAENVFKSYQDKIQICCVRPATVCGLSPRLRLDVSVNMLVYQAFRFGKINVLGGKQIRPNIHINDLVRIFNFFINKNFGKFIIVNAGFENISILDLAKKISKIIPTKILVKKSNDPRSYRLDSTKISKLGFKPKYGINNAIIELYNFFKKNKYKDNLRNYNIKTMKKFSIK